MLLSSCSRVYPWLRVLCYTSLSVFLLGFVLWNIDNILCDSLRWILPEWYISYSALIGLKCILTCAAFVLLCQSHAPEAASRSWSGDAVPRMVAHSDGTRLLPAHTPQVLFFSPVMCECRFACSELVWFYSSSVDSAWRLGWPTSSTDRK